MKSIRIVFASAALVLAAISPAAAQVQSKAQQACLNAVVKTDRRISGAVLADASQCLRKGAAGSLPVGVTATHCAFGDLKGKVAKSRAKVGVMVGKFCATLPSFGFVDALTAEDAYVNDNHALSVDAFLADLDATLVASSALDPVGRCSSTLPTMWRKLEDTMHREVETCLKAGLKAGTVMDAASAQLCLDRITADTRAHIAKAVATAQVQLTNKCPTGNLDTIFPGLTSICGSYGAATDSAGLAACSRDRVACRICRIFNFAYGLDRDCDLFDDTLANGSCPACGNGVVDSGEGCDDGNKTSGDGCTAQCIAEFCGDGTINNNGAEVCDNGIANSNTTPGACRLNCVPAYCGDGVTDPGNGEECDDGNTNEADGCTSQCTSCGNGHVAGAEQCDDGNNTGGDCCSASCTFEVVGSSCTGAPSSQCTAPACDGAGACTEQAAHAGQSCEDGDECSNASACTAGACVATSYLAAGAACRWAIVGNPTTGSGNDRRVDLLLSATTTGDVCGDFARVGGSVVTNGDIVTEQGDSVTQGADFESTSNIDASNVITNNAAVDGRFGEILPGLAVTTVAPGQVVAKTPAPTVYDTTGTHPKVADCAAAQLAISTNTANLLDALPAPTNLAGTMADLPLGTTMTITAASPGGLNVIDVNKITAAGRDVTLNFDGGGDPATVIILRVQGSLNTGINWHWNLQNGLTADHFMIYGKGGGTGNCTIDQDNIGSGTIFCPNGRIHMGLRTQWTGALYGGGTSLIAIEIGEQVVFTHERFTGF